MYHCHIFFIVALSFCGGHEVLQPVSFLLSLDISEFLRYKHATPTYYGRKVFKHLTSVRESLKDEKRKPWLRLVKDIADVCRTAGTKCKN
jgi:hypothetical protein